MKQINKRCNNFTSFLENDSICATLVLNSVTNKKIDIFRFRVASDFDLAQTRHLPNSNSKVL